MTLPLINWMEKSAPEALAQILHHRGFAILTQHPIVTKLIYQVHEGWKDFFSSIEKNRFQYDKNSLDGYFPFGTEKAKPGILLI